MRRTLSRTPVAAVGMTLGGLMIVLGVVHLVLGRGAQWSWLILIGAGLVIVAALYARRPLPDAVARAAAERRRHG